LVATVAGQAAIVGAGHAVVAIGIGATINTAGPGFVTGFARTQARITCRDTALIGMTDFGPIAKDTVIGAVAVDGQGLTNAAYTGIVGTGDAVVAVSVEQASHTLMNALGAELTAGGTGIAVRYAAQADGAVLVAIAEQGIILALTGVGLV